MTDTTTKGEAARLSDDLNARIWAAVEADDRQTGFERVKHMLEAAGLPFLVETTREAEADMVRAEKAEAERDQLEATWKALVTQYNALKRQVEALETNVRVLTREHKANLASAGDVVEAVEEVINRVYGGDAELEDVVFETLTAIDWWSLKERVEAAWCWRPIETAPRDGTPILIINYILAGEPDSGIDPEPVLVRYSSRQSDCKCWLNYEASTETFRVLVGDSAIAGWMPIPPIPTPAEKGGES